MPPHPYYTQTRATPHLIETGNYFSDSVENICEILRREQREDTDSKLKYISRLTDVLNDDVIIIPKPPCITVSFGGWEEVIHTIGQKNVTVEYIVELNIFYYHNEVQNNIRKSEIRDALWEVSRLLRRNSDLNGLSSKGAIIHGGEIVYRARNKSVYEGGLIRMSVPILDKTRTGVSPVP
jgi:hypothetical protein